MAAPNFQKNIFCHLQIQQPIQIRVSEKFEARLRAISEIQFSVGGQRDVNSGLMLGKEVCGKWDSQGRWEKSR